MSNKNFEATSNDELIVLAGNECVKARECLKQDNLKEALSHLINATGMQGLWINRKQHDNVKL